MNAEMTKTELAAEINEIRATLNRPALAAWKIKDLTKDQLVEIYDGLLFEIEQDGEAAVDDDPSAQALVDQVLAGDLTFESAILGIATGTIALDPLPQAEPVEDTYGAYIEANEPSIGRSAAPKRKRERAPLYNETNQRRCGCCGNYFDITEFGAYKSGKDGLASYTKDHTKAYRAAKKS